MMTNRWLNIEDERVTAAELEAAVEAQVVARREALGELKVSFPAYGTAAVCPEMPADFPASMNLYHHLRLLNNNYNRAETEPELVESPTTQVPVLGSLWKQVRKHAHHLVLFYVNRWGSQQTEVNGYMTHTLNELTLLLEQQQRQIQALEAEVERLRERVN